MVTLPAIPHTIPALPADHSRKYLALLTVTHDRSLSYASLCIDVCNTSCMYRISVLIIQGLFLGVGTRNMACRRVSLPGSNPPWLGCPEITPDPLGSARIRAVWRHETGAHEFPGVGRKIPFRLRQAYVRTCSSLSSTYMQGYFVAKTSCKGLLVSRRS
jgi:hypothetical protein